MEFIIGLIVLWFIYWVLTKKKRRNKAIDDVLVEAIMRNGGIRVTHIYWESFCSYAVDYGATVYEDNKYDQMLYRFTRTINGIQLYIEFAKGHDGSVLVLTQIQ